MKCIYDSHGNPVTLDDQLAEGGEATVYRVAGRPELLAKIYKTPRAGYDQKLAWMIAHPPAAAPQARQHAALAWPTALLYAADGTFAGYQMPYIRHTVALLEVFNPRLRRQPLPGFTGRYLYRAARNLAASLHALHARGYVIGDLSESNVLVTPTALVTIIDADSFQVQGDGQVFFCPVGKLEYTPPELQGKDLQETLQSPLHDNFGLAVLIFQLLMAGSHPFRSRWLGAGDAPPLAEKIRQGLYPYATPAPKLVAPPPRHTLDHLPPEVGQLFQRCFVAGHTQPEVRPGAREWAQTLAAAEQSLVQCAEGHDYAGHLPECPECRQALVRVERVRSAPAAVAARPAPPAVTAPVGPAPSTPKAPPVTTLTWEQKQAMADDEVLDVVGQKLAFLCGATLFVIPVVFMLILNDWSFFLSWSLIFLICHMVRLIKFTPLVRPLVRPFWLRLHAPARRFQRESLATQGSVISRKKGITDGDYWITYRFTTRLANGTTKEWTRTERVTEEMYSHLQMGRDVAVRYAPYDPGLIRLELPPVCSSTKTLWELLKTHPLTALGPPVISHKAVRKRALAHTGVLTQGTVIDLSYDQVSRAHLVSYSFTSRMADGTFQPWFRTERVPRRLYRRLQQGSRVLVRYSPVNMGEACIELRGSDAMQQQGEMMIKPGSVILLLLLVASVLVLLLAPELCYNMRQSVSLPNNSHTTGRSHPRGLF
ncbi:MAG: helix-hairpin-helix domain-containing protein [Chloroflexaceae bacterium]